MPYTASLMMGEGGQGWQTLHIQRWGGQGGVTGGCGRRPGPDPVCCHSQLWADPLAHLSSGAALPEGLTFEVTSQMAEEFKTREGPPPTGRRWEGHVLGWVTLAASPRWVQMVRACKPGRGGMEVPACRVAICWQTRGEAQV